MDMMRWVGGVPGIRKVLWISLAAAFAIISSRGTVDSISFLFLHSTNAPGTDSTKPFEAGVVDRKPKPCRQQELTSNQCLLRLHWLSHLKPVLADASAWMGAALVPAFGTEGWNPDFDDVQATKPSYLKPSETTPRGQLAPPAFPLS